MKKTHKAISFVATVIMLMTIWLGVGAMIFADGVPTHRLIMAGIVATGISWWLHATAYKYSSRR